MLETESENWNFLKYGRIGKHPMQSLYTRYYVPYLVIIILNLVEEAKLNNYSIHIVQILQGVRVSCDAVH